MTGTRNRYEEYYSVRRASASERQSSNRDLRCQGWWQLYLSACLAGISAAVSYHALQSYKRSKDRGCQSGLVVVSNTYGEQPLRLQMKRLVTGIPGWFWMTLPAYVGVLSGYPLSWWFLGVSVVLYPSTDPKSPVSGADKTPRSNNNHPRDSVARMVDESSEVTLSTDQQQQQRGQTSRKKKAKNDRYLDILVHNISHTDLILGLDPEKSKHYVRPRFSSFDAVCRQIQTYSSPSDPIVEFPRHRRSMEAPRYSIQDTPQPGLAAAGIRLQKVTPLTDVHQVRKREDFDNYFYHIHYVFFPLLATLHQVWKQQISERNHKNLKRVLILVTGVGTPHNSQHSIDGNSTRVCADLMQRFLETIDPDLTVVKIHSTTNVFRNDENIHFVNQELVPVIDSYRDAHATNEPYPDEVQPPTSKASIHFDNVDWRSTMNVILSVGDGSPARTHAIQASLRSYRPTYYIFWQRKTFWHESKVVADDVEVHSFEAMETLPPRDVDVVKDRNVQLVVDEMRRFYHEISVTLARNNNDMRRFWLRKSQKPVLAVLVVQSAEMEAPELFRATNMEVSMPTGSLCAERNAIGSALSANPNLKRQDLKMIAVLGVPPVESGEGVRRNRSYSSFVEELSGPMNSHKSSIGSEYEPEEWDEVTSPNEDNNSLEPMRRITLFSKTRNIPKRTVVVHGSKDNNPLAPCGACNEWLKKIAESNPYFKIVTFTDANCNGVYISPCQD